MHVGRVDAVADQSDSPSRFCETYKPGYSGRTRLRIPFIAGLGNLQWRIPAAAQLGLGNWGSGGATMRRSLHIFAIGCAAPLLARPADAETYPARPITIVVGFAAGSGIDVITRLIGHRLEASLNQRVLIENKVGANAGIAATYVAHARPDGYTLLAGGSGTHAANPNLFKSISYDPARDFKPISLTGSFVYMLVAHPQVPVKSAVDLIDFAKANPGKVSYATSNSSGLISAMTFVRWAGIDMNHV